MAKKKETRRQNKKDHKAANGGAPVRQFSKEEIASLQKLMIMQATQREIKSWFEIDERTLEAICQSQLNGSYAEIYEIFSGKGVASIRRQLFQQAQSNNWDAIKWLSKQYLGHSDKVAQKVEIVSDQTFNIKIGFADESEPEYNNADQDTTTKKV